MAFSHSLSLASSRHPPRRRYQSTVPTLSKIQRRARPHFLTWSNKCTCRRRMSNGNIDMTGGQCVVMNTLFRPNHLYRACHRKQTSNYICIHGRLRLLSYRNKSRVSCTHNYDISRASINSTVTLWPWNLG